MSDRPAASRAAGVADEAPQVMVAVSGVSREFGSGHTASHALRQVSFTVRRGQLVTVCGRSGSGKTSLLNIIGGLDLPTTGSVPRVREETVATMLAIVGLSEHAAQRPNELSGGQQQRVAIARALAGRPQLLIADEPTSQLDLETGRQIMRLILTVVHAEGITALVATHDEALIDLADEVLTLDDGRIVT
jgi:putative ABC transport system ATP-binding protein